jgi:uncharacterized membrane protein
LIEFSSILAVLAAVLFGAAMVIAKFGLRYAAPALGASISIPTSAVMMWSLSPLLLDLSKFDLNAAIVFALVGVVFPALVTWLAFIATERIGPAITSSLSSTAPIFAVASAIMFLGEPVTLNRMLGVALIVLGIVALSAPSPVAGREWPRWLLLLPLIGSMLRGIMVTLGKFGLGLWPEPFAASLIGYTVSAVVIIAIAARHKDNIENPVRALPWFATVGILNGTAVLLMYSALTTGEVAVVASIVAASPLAALALSGIFLREDRLEAVQIAGLVTVLVGALVVLN